MSSRLWKSFALPFRGRHFFSANQCERRAAERTGLVCQPEDDVKVVRFGSFESGDATPGRRHPRSIGPALPLEFGRLVLASRNDHRQPTAGLQPHGAQQFCVSTREAERRVNVGSNERLDVVNAAQECGSRYAVIA